MGLRRIRYRLLLTLFVICIIAFTARLLDYFKTTHSEWSFLNLVSSGPNRFYTANLEAPDFWSKVFKVFEVNKLQLPLENLDDAIRYIDKSQQKDGPSTKENLLSKAYIPEEVQLELKQKHFKVMNELPSEIPKALYKKDMCGVVLVGGGRFSWLAYLALLSLRRSGSRIPAEVVMPKLADYENELEFCKVVLPKLNAECVVIPEELGSVVTMNWAKNLASYQFKILALLVSSFQNVLLLDSDNIIIENPDSIFESDLFHNYGMITWSDYWSRTISPIFYDVLGIKVNEKKRVRYNRFPLRVPPDVTDSIPDSNSVPYHDLEGAIPDLSTESGQLFVNKLTHGKTLLLALYYNLNGPNVFYKLFSLGEQGAGDKDTFAAAAVATSQKYYQVNSFIKTLGYFDNNGNYRGVAMAQKDPLVDYAFYEQLVLKPQISKENIDMTLEDQFERLEILKKEKFDSNNNVPIFCIHCNFPKLDPLELFGEDSLYDAEKRRLKYRLYGGIKIELKFQSLDLEGAENKEVDFELQQWEMMYKSLCKDKIHFTHFKDTNMDELCQKITNEIQWLAET
ncbi:uncharacterized protein PRCAT00005271001 [Priceomyces carsonii]|uniref:uncharacterized protein n=1 Tax=Priceomyces carsonii TaxID=28549 RepID=UPI002ED786B5|nr:unnamed protein product [Priceomyces carsonii]